MMSKQQRLYYEQNNQEKVKEELIELAKQQRDHEDKYYSFTTFNPHINSYYN